MFCSKCGESLQVSFKFCPKCGKDLAANLAHGSCDVDSQKNIIETYWFFSFLVKFHDIHISLSTLKRRLRDCGLKRRNSADLNQNEVRKIIREELDGPCCMSPYRAMWHTLHTKQPQTNTEGTMESNTKSALAENHLFKTSDNIVQKR